MAQSLWDMLRGKMPDEAKAAPAADDLQKVGTQTVTPRRAADTAALIDAYAKNEIAFACIEIKRKAMQDPRLIVEERQRDGSWKESPGHPFQRLMMRPLRSTVSTPGMDGATFIGLQVASWDIARFFCAEKMRSKSGAIVGLNPLNPANLSPWYNQQRQHVGYTWGRGRDKIDFPFEDVLVRQNTDFGGATPLSVALGAIDADTAQTDFIRAFFNNAGQPGGILKVKGTYSQEKADTLAAKWGAKYGRHGDGWFKPAVLDENADYQRTGSLLNELDSESIRGLTESRICAPFGVPPLIVYAYVGLLRATYSNLKEAWASFWDAELSPALKALAEFLTWHLLTEFVSEELIYEGRIRLRWDLSQVAALQEDVDAIATRGRNAFMSGGITLNEYRSQIGQAPDPAGDYYLRTLAQIAEPAGQAPASTAPKRTQRLIEMKARSTHTIERRIATAVQGYLKEQYMIAADAVAGG